MTDRQLMQQALDALKIAEVDGNCYYEATELLRTRLAHCDRCGKRLGGEGDIHTCTPDPIGDAQDRLIAEIAAQPEQEPVAWMYQCTTDNSGPVLLQHRTNWAKSGTGLWIETPLYTTPPAAAQPAPVPLTEWQPIDTAPKGYTDVLLWNGQNVGEARYIPEEDADEFGWWWANTGPGNYGESRIDRQPTHWMPMPAAPIEAAHGIKEKNNG